MPVSVHAIGTAVPETVLTQGEVQDLLGRQPGLGRRQRRLTEAACRDSGIETRHTVVGDLGGAATVAPLLLADGAILAPGTGARNEAYRRHAPELLEQAAVAALEAAGDLHAADVTHIVTVSCTGFFAPGPEAVLTERLGLDPTVERYHLGFMGCHGAFPALRAALACCLARPDAVVLVACVELCTLHLQPPSEADAILAASLFGDGAAAAVVSARPAQPGAPVLDLEVLRTELVGAGQGDLTWTIGDTGFAMQLSSYLPRLLGQHLEKVVAPLFDTDPALAGQPFATVPRWAVHPGGRSVLDRVQSALQLGPDALAASRSVLRDYGNMSSATVLFVLRELLSAPPADGPERVCALAFGPGLTVESALLTSRVGP